MYKCLAVLFRIAKNWKQSKSSTTNSYKQIVSYLIQCKSIQEKKRETTDTEEYQKHYAKCKLDPEDHTLYSSQLYYIVWKEKLY